MRCFKTCSIILLILKTQNASLGISQSNPSCIQLRHSHDHNQLVDWHVTQQHANNETGERHVQCTYVCHTQRTVVSHAAFKSGHPPQPTTRKAQCCWYHKQWLWSSSYCVVFVKIAADFCPLYLLCGYFKKYGRASLYTVFELTNL